MLVDRTLTARALSNIVENALHAMPGPGSLTIDGRSEGGMVRLDVTDTGVGMDEEALERVFEPYFSTKTTGTGLGLPIARRNIELNGGSIEVRSAKGAGTTVTRQAADRRWIDASRLTASLQATRCQGIPWELAVGELRLQPALVGRRVGRGRRQLTRHRIARPAPDARDDPRDDRADGIAVRQRHERDARVRRDQRQHHRDEEERRSRNGASRRRSP